MIDRWVYLYVSPSGEAILQADPPDVSKENGLRCWRLINGALWEVQGAHRVRAYRGPEDPPLVSFEWGPA